MNFQIHALKDEFLEQIDEIEQASFSHPWSMDAYKKEIENQVAHYLVLTNEGEVCAYGGYWQIFAEGHITNIAVKNEFRKQGLGTELVKALIEDAKNNGITAMTLEVRASNEPAIKLYEKMGFASAGVRPKYYPDGEDAVIMWLEEI